MAAVARSVVTGPVVHSPTRAVASSASASADATRVGADTATVGAAGTGGGAVVRDPRSTTTPAPMASATTTAAPAATRRAVRRRRATDPASSAPSSAVGTKDAALRSRPSRSLLSTDITDLLAQQDRERTPCPVQADLDGRLAHPQRPGHLHHRQVLE